MTIKQIFDEIGNESSTNEKMVILNKHKDNELLKRVLYLANSRRVKFFIKQIPAYQKNDYTLGVDLSDKVLGSVLDKLSFITDRIITGGAAIEYLKDILENIDADSAYIIERIIDKDCKIGLGTRMINKVYPDLIEKTGYMGCKPYSKELILKLLASSKGNGVYSQEKMDGRFLNSVIQGNEVVNESRQGEPTILEYPFFVSELQQLDNCVLNGELTMGSYLGEPIPRYISNGIIASLISIGNKRVNGEDTTKEVAKFESKHMNYYEALKLQRFVKLS